MAPQEGHERGGVCETCKKVYDDKSKLRAHEWRRQPQPTAAEEEENAGGEVHMRTRGLKGAERVKRWSGVAVSWTPEEVVLGPILAASGPPDSRLPGLRLLTPAPKEEPKPPTPLQIRVRFESRTRTSSKVELMD
jgi:hypothetical protein